ncbi:ABC transporter permease [Rhodococcus sp. T2V]|uniref:ABC transporter permease n=1 Tax=Rhodococcus sp. T2V TaxID=3034164 RepID=UPI0023E217BE|nr:ABC transporter permease [Rhodococcus sp. T2V]MDF3312589.1 ABC transporter permease [Rhodococcus sp. T2V]
MTDLDVRMSAPAPGAFARARRQGIAAMGGRRVLFIIPVLAVVSAAVFAAAAHSPFDPLVGYLGTRYLTTSEADKTAIADQLGFTKPWYETYGSWVHGVLAGDLGISRSFNQPVAQVISERLPWTLLLVTVGLGAAIIFSLLLGVWAGMQRGSWLDRLVAAVCLVVQGLPPFVLALTAIVFFSLGMGWFPVAGLTDGGADPTVGQVSRHLILPAGVLAISQMPWLLLAVRESVASARGEDFVAGALARGVDVRTITRRHIVPTSLAPFVTIIGVRLPEIIVGAVLVEEVFSWPGIAGALVESARNLDMALLALLTVGTVVAVMLGSLLADIAYALLDPRVSTDG